MDYKDKLKEMEELYVSMHNSFNYSTNEHIEKLYYGLINIIVELEKKLTDVQQQISGSATAPRKLCGDCKHLGIMLDQVPCSECKDHDCHNA